jgi:hypothetical protein
MFSLPLPVCLPAGADRSPMNPSLFALCAIVMSLLCVFAAAVPDAGAAATAEGDRDGLAGIVAPGAVVEKLAGDLKFTEGPVYDPAGFLLFSDIPADTLYRYTPGSPASSTCSGSRRGRPTATRATAKAG